MTTSRKCPICGYRDGKSLWEIKEILPVDISLPSDVEVVECTSCGFCYANTYATQQMYDEYYKNSNIYSSRSPKISPEYEKKLQCLIREYVDKDSVILDMGCGSGAFLQSLKLYGYSNLYGMDVADNIVSELQTMGIHGKKGGVYDEISQEEIGKYDVVCMNCVLEHLLYPRDAISNTKKYLKNNGVMLIAVPDMENLQHGNNGPAHHFHHEHINYFTVEALSMLMRKEGFECIRVERVCECNDNDNEALFIGLYRNSNLGNNTCFSENRIQEGDILRQYFELYRNNMERERVINEQLIGKRVVLYGMGAKLFQVLASSSLASMDIVHCIDGSKARIGKRISIREKEHMIESPDCLNDTNVTVCVCVNSKQYEREIINNIKQKHIENIVVIP